METRLVRHPQHQSWQYWKLGISWRARNAYAALVFPLAFALCKVLGNWLQAGFAMPLLSTVLAVLFVLDIEVPRPKTSVLIVLCLASLLASAYVMWWQ